MSLEAVMAEVRALAGTDHAAPSRQLTRDTTGEPLTVREQEVVRLLERGLTDRQIGAELGISRSTASVHVRNVLAKLDVHSRWQVHDRLTQQPTATR